MSTEDRAIIANLISNNLEYIDVKTQSFLPDFYHCLANCKKEENGEIGFCWSHTRVNEVFIQIVHSVLSESTKLCRLLKLPDIGQSVGKLYAQSQKRKLTKDPKEN